MNARENAFLGMTSVVKATCEAYTPAWQSFAPFADAYEDFLAILPVAVQAGAQQFTKSEGSTEGKAKLRATFSDLLLRLGDALDLYARLHNLPLLRADAHTTRSALRDLSEDGLVGRGAQLLGLANGLDLSAYGIDAAFLAETSAASTAFVQAIGTPAHRRAEKKAATRLLAECIRRIRTVLTEELDPAAAVLRYTQPQFYSMYKSSRAITDPGFRRRAFRISIVDAQSRRPLAGVRGVVMPGSIKKKSGKGGQFYVDRLAEGEYTLTLSLDGYAERTVVFAVVDGEGTKVEVEM
jgi:hypothetical protein